MTTRIPTDPTDPGFPRPGYGSDFNEDKLRLLIDAPFSQEWLAEVCVTFRGLIDEAVQSRAEARAWCDKADELQDQLDALT